MAPTWQLLCCTMRLGGLCTLCAEPWGIRRCTAHLAVAMLHHEVGLAWNLWAGGWLCILGQGLGGPGDAQQPPGSGHSVPRGEAAGMAVQHKVQSTHLGLSTINREARLVNLF